MHYIGLDCHIRTLEFAVVNEAGHLVKADRVATSAKGFIEFVKKVPPPRSIYVEEGTLAAWALETCTRFKEKLVICDARKNHWISSSAQKSDPIDALKLAQLARGGYISEIHHPVGHRRQFRELMTSYHDTVKGTTRIKNKIKAKFRQNGIQCTGTTVYSMSHREEWMAKLPEETTLQLILNSLWRQLDHSEQIEQELLTAAKMLAKSYPEIKHFEALPRIGFISAATISAILETPHRFADKKKVWAYAGLGIIARSSGGKVYSEKLTPDYNRLLKYTIKQATEAAIQAKDNPFRQKYLDKTLIRGVAPHCAKLTIARDMLATMWAMWRKGEKYNPEIKEQTVYKQD